jgi:hypothetical protein
LFYFILHTAITNEPRTYFIHNPPTMPKVLCNNRIPELPEYLQKVYWPLHNRILFDSSTPKEDIRILLFYATNDGLGNRIQGMLSTWLHALLTNRAFLVVWPKDTESGASFIDLFIDVHSVDLDNVYTRLTPKAREVLAAQYVRWIPYCRACPIRRPATIFNNLLCNPLGAVEIGRPAMGFRTTQWYAPVLARNPAFRERVCQWTGSDTFGVLYRELLPKPSPIVQRIIDDIKAVFSAKRVIGVQIRHLEALAVSDEMVDVFVRCAVKLRNGIEDSNIFLATDDPNLRKKLSSLFGMSLIHTDASHARNEVSSVQQALADIYLLGMADDLLNFWLRSSWKGLKGSAYCHS